VIVVQFSACADLGSRLIRYFGHGAGFSHVDAVLSSGALLGARSDVREGVPAGVQVRPPHYLDRFKPRKVRVEIDADAATTAAFYRALLSQIGKPYDMSAILAFALDRDWRDQGAWICSEFNIWGAEACGRVPRLATRASKIDPDDCALVYSALGARFIPLPA